MVIFDQQYMWVMVFIVLCFAGLMVMFYCLLRNIGEMTRTVRSERDQLTQALHGMEKRLFQQLSQQMTQQMIQSQEDVGRAVREAVQQAVGQVLSEVSSGGLSATAWQAAGSAPSHVVPETGPDNAGRAEFDNREVGNFAQAPAYRDGMTVMQPLDEDVAAYTEAAEFDDAVEAVTGDFSAKICTADEHDTPDTLYAEPQAPVDLAAGTSFDEADYSGETAGPDMAEDRGMQDDVSSDSMHEDASPDVSAGQDDPHVQGGLGGSGDDFMDDAAETAAQPVSAVIVVEDAAGPASPALHASQEGQVDPVDWAIDTIAFSGYDPISVALLPEVTLPATGHDGEMDGTDGTPQGVLSISQPDVYLDVSDTESGQEAELDADADSPDVAHEIPDYFSGSENAGAADVQPMDIFVFPDDRDAAEPPDEVMSDPAVLADLNMASSGDDLRAKPLSLVSEEQEAGLPAEPEDDDDVIALVDVYVPAESDVTGHALDMPGSVNPVDREPLFDPERTAEPDDFVFGEEITPESDALYSEEEAGLQEPYGEASPAELPLPDLHLSETGKTVTEGLFLFSPEEEAVHGAESAPDFEMDRGGLPDLGVAVPERSKPAKTRMDTGAYLQVADAPMAPLWQADQEFVSTAEGKDESRNELYDEVYDEDVILLTSDEIVHDEEDGDTGSHYLRSASQAATGEDFLTAGMSRSVYDHAVVDAYDELSDSATTGEVLDEPIDEDSALAKALAAFGISDDSAADGKRYLSDTARTETAASAFPEVSAGGTDRPDAVGEGVETAGIDDDSASLDFEWEDDTIPAEEDFAFSDGSEEDLPGLSDAEEGQAVLPGFFEGEDPVELPASSRDNHTGVTTGWNTAGSGAKKPVNAEKQDNILEYIVPE